MAVWVAGGGAAAGLLVPEWGADGGISPTADICMLATAVAILCAGTFFYVHWHIVQDQALAWLATVTVAFGLQELHWFMLIVGDRPGSDAQTAWIGLYQVGITVGLGILVTAGLRLPVRRDPLATGLLLGASLIVVRLLVLQLPVSAPPTTAYVLIFTALGVASVVNAVRLYRSHLIPATMRRPLAATSVLLGVGQVMSTVAGAPPAIILVGMLANMAGGTCLLLTAAERARHAAIDDAVALAMLQRRLADAELDMHTDQARLHEIRSTLAGIATASDLLRRSEINPARREQLSEMTRSELHRLERLVCLEPSGAPVPTELDAALRPVVVRHQAAGLPIRWQPTGHVAIARSDDVAEIVNVLLSNARRHAGTSPVDVTVRSAGDRVEIAVTDQGPGVDADLRDRIFAWGTRSTTSPGEGVGLATAQLLARQLGGDLRLDPVLHPGARFVLSLTPASLAAATVTRQEFAS
ncbi:hypothetical protein ASC77_08815 [Nocardioides sp. Root1257]|uniref:sensor histidine kinase n=1 Tax=unclassified Nocardioides TaxID=2615069 RepID=UPI0006F5B45B|nr:MULTISPECIES: HAMP domain-containing sensor histidine kinase [unclassified Nocardioides]KQW48822.1 hypothetical protein ASC77_08815 [Nocardioides sp. Root1257]KRC47997.1 hypothetical protein ASE24_08820 [Nocardioides sp. Root224]